MEKKILFKSWKEPLKQKKIWKNEFRLREENIIHFPG